jgi:ribose-phosphate pyrophosphokinase
MTTLAVNAFSEEAEPAVRLARALDAAFSPVWTHRFPDGEIMPMVASPAAEVTIVYRSLDRPNEKLVELLLAADAWRRAGARRLILVAPYFCYLRQDTVFAPGEPLSRDVIAPLLGARFDAIVTVQAHLHRTADLARATGVPSLNLSAVEPLIAALPAYPATPLIVGPDEESRPWVEAWARRLGGDAATLHKTRCGDRSIRIEAPKTLDASGRAALIVDDVASSGETLEQAVKLLRRAGAASIDIAVAHALMTPRATDRLTRSGVRRIVSTDSVRHPTNAACLAPFLAEAVRAIGITT